MKLSYDPGCPPVHQAHLRDTQDAFERAFERDFTLDHYRGLCVFAPPPYLTSVRDKHPRYYERLWRIDRRTAHWPLLRSMGDHFLIVMTKRS